MRPALAGRNAGENSVVIRQNSLRNPALKDLDANSSGGIVLKKLSPNAAEAKRLAARYGQSRVCVRYREDKRRGRRMTTIELIIDERPLPPPAAVRIAFDETELRRQVKAAGGIRESAQKLWQLPRSAVRKLKPEHRLVSANA